MPQASAQRWLPPLYLFLALAMLVVGFCLLAVGPPEASVDLHEARAAADETYLATWEADLIRRQRLRIGTIVAVFTGSVFMAVSAFRAMRV